MLLVPPSRAPLERFRHSVLPMKLFAYFAAGRPILAPRLPDTAELLVHERTALLVAPDDSRQAAAALDRLIAEPELAARLGADARRLADGLSWDHRAAKIEAFLEARLAAQRSAYSRTVTPPSRTIAGAAQAPKAAGK
jgi:glycosyltransferase involved in cell wall biosynthesis